MTNTTNPYTYTAPTDKTPGERNDAVDYNAEALENIRYLKFQGAEAYPGSRNFLTNSHMDVWQRGSSFTVASSTKTYCADRWMAYRVGTGGATVSRQTGPTGQQYTQRVQRDSGNSSTTAITLYQALDTVDSLPLAGTVCQLKLNLKAGANFSAASSQVTVKVTYGTGTDQSPEASWTGSTDALSTTQAITTTATDYTFNDITIPSSATQVKVSVAFTPVGTASTNDWFEISAGQMTIGGTVGWERLPYAVTLLRCQRFYWQWGPWGGTQTYLATGQVWSATTAYVWVPWPVTMRRVPDVTFSAANDFSINSLSVSANTSSIAASSITVNGASINPVSSGMTVRDPMFLDNNQDKTNAAIYVNAEL